MGNRKSTAAFTLVEMLVVIGLIAALIAVVGVVATRARGTANKFQLAAQLQAISVALDAYKTDFGSYPITQPAVATTTADDKINADGLRGARTLCKALMGACPQGVANAAAVAPTPTFDTNRPDQDGNEGPGFRVLPRSGVFAVDGTASPNTLQGKVYGPYLSGSQLTMGKTNDLTGAVDTSDKAYDDTTVLLDANGSPILYYPCLNPQAPVGTAAALKCAYVALGRVDKTPTGANEPIAAPYYPGTPMYVSTDNGMLLDAPTFRKLLGDKNADGLIDPASEKPAVRGKYLLWSAGPDGAFGVNAAKENKPDDVTNFDLE